MMVRSPSRTEIAEARREGELRCGVPLVVTMGPGTVAVPNLAAVVAGDPDPWYIMTTPAEGVVDLSTADNRSVYVGGMLVHGADIGAVDAALRLSRDLAGDRHSAAADRRRLAAGRCAMRVADAMIRARLLDAVDGWSALADTGRIVEDDPAHGTLIEPAPDLKMSCRVLIVTCPSTGRRYALRVPAEQHRARTARLWTFGDSWDLAPEVET